MVFWRSRVSWTYIAVSIGIGAMGPMRRCWCDAGILFFLSAPFSQGQRCKKLSEPQSAASCCSLLALFMKKCQQISINLVSIGRGHSVWESRVNLERGILQQCRGQRRRRCNGHNLVIVTMKNESWHIELLEIFCKVGFGESLNTVISSFHTSHHSLQPPALTDAFRNLGAGPVVSVKRKSNVFVKLRPIFHIFSP